MKARRRPHEATPWGWDPNAPALPWAEQFLTLELLADYDRAAPGINCSARICRLVGRNLVHEGQMGRLARQSA
jgi:hypothetical protein